MSKRKILMVTINLALKSLEKSTESETVRSTATGALWILENRHAQQNGPVTTTHGWYA